MRPRRIVALALVVGLSLAADPAAAAPADASDSPRVSGPLLGSPLGCEDNGPSGPGELRGQSCTWSYELAPAHTNPTEDFSALWTQIEIDPGSGMCAQRIEFEVRLSGGERIVSAAPVTAAAAREAVTGLVVDAGAAAPVPGRIEQDVAPPPGRVRIEVGDHRYSYTWTGRSRRKVMIAVGIQFSHGRVPPDFWTAMSTSTGSGGGSCGKSSAVPLTRRG